MRKALVAVLWLATFIETVLGVGILFAPTALMGSFHISDVTPDIMYLAAIVGWFCLVIAVLAGLTARWVSQLRSEGRVLAIVLGIFWIGIGVHLAIAYDRPSHLVLDAAKGLVILILALRLKPTVKAPTNH